MKKLDKNILKILRDYYLLSVRGMALSADEGPEYWRHENAAAEQSRNSGLFSVWKRAEVMKQSG